MKILPSSLVFAVGCATTPFDSHSSALPSFSPYHDVPSSLAFTFVDVNPGSETYKTEVSLADLLESHDTVVVNFFEPWCEPCVHELPALERLSHLHGVRVVGFTEDYYSFPALQGKNAHDSWIPIEDRVSFPFFDSGQEHAAVLSFLQTYAPHTLMPSSSGHEEMFLRSGYPTTLFFYASNAFKNICSFNGAQNYETFVQYAKRPDSCFASRNYTEL